MYLQSYDMKGGERGGDAVGRAEDHRLWHVQLWRPGRLRPPLREEGDVSFDHLTSKIPSKNEKGCIVVC